MNSQRRPRRDRGRPRGLHYHVREQLVMDVDTADKFAQLARHSEHSKSQFFRLLIRRVFHELELTGEINL